MCVLAFLNGWFQGMGYPPYAKNMVTWFSRSERGAWWSWWNVSHNLGGGIIAPLATLGIYLFGTWHSIFFFPALISIVLAVVTFFLLKDTPQSCGLPPIEEYKHETVATEVKDENKTTFKEIFYKYILHNKYLWYLAIAISLYTSSVMA